MNSPAEKWLFWHSPGTVATVCGWGGQTYNLLISSSFRIPCAKNGLKSVHFWLSCSKNKNVSVFYGTQCICKMPLQLCILIILKIANEVKSTVPKIHLWRSTLHVQTQDVRQQRQPLQRQSLQRTHTYSMVWSASHGYYMHTWQKLPRLLENSILHTLFNVRVTQHQTYITLITHDTKKHHMLHDVYVIMYCNYVSNVVKVEIHHE